MLGGISNSVQHLINAWIVRIFGLLIRGICIIFDSLLEQLPLFGGVGVVDTKFWIFSVNSWWKKDICIFTIVNFILFSWFY